MNGKGKLETLRHSLTPGAWRELNDWAGGVGGQMIIRPPRRSLADDPRCWRRGFTLIELLVVTAIITVLLGLLAGAIARAKVSARRIVCLDRQHQWTIAFQSYADDHEGWIPREGYHSDGEVYRNNWAQVLDESARDVWYNALADYVGHPAAARYGESAESRVSFYRGGSFFHCPSAPFPADVRSATYLSILFSVAMNSQLIEYGRAPSIRYDKIRQPSKTPLFLDNLLVGEKMVVEAQAGTDLGQPAACANRFAGRRHGNSGNMVFPDGHANSLRGEEVVVTTGDFAGLAVEPSDKVVWDPYEPSSD